MIRILVAAALLLFTTPLLAAETGWQEVAPQAEMRVISAPLNMGGREMLAIELRMPRTLKTYWQVPGETGIPAQVDVTADGTPVAAQIVWPLPTRELDGGFVDNVYRGDLILPVAVPADSPQALSVDVLMGICSDICVPVRASFELEGRGEQDDANTLRIRQALNRTPIPFEGPDAPVGAVHFDAENRLLLIEYDPARIDPAKLFVSAGDPAILFGMPEVDAGMVTLPLLGNAGLPGLAGTAITVTFGTPNGPYAVERQL